MLIGADGGDLTAETLIVGAGTMGLWLATSLAKAGRGVLLIEAGGRVATTAANIATTEAQGRLHRGTHQGRANGLGGTSTLWGGQLAEFDAQDFDRSYAPWPIDLAELKPWYGAAYRRLGIGEPQPAERYRARLGDEAGDACGIERFFTSWLPEPNFARLFRREALNDPNIRILCNATCSAISFDGETATGIRIAVDGETRYVKAKRIVFALGTIATSRFFLSTARQGGVPWQDDKRIGRYFQDHIAAKAATVAVIDERRFRAYFENAVVDGIKLQPKLRFAASARADGVSDSIGVSGYFVFGSNYAEHLANIKQIVRALQSAADLASLRRLPAEIFAVGAGFAPFVWRYVRDRRIMAFFDKSLEFQVQCEQRPIVASQIGLTGDAPLADGLFRAVVDWRVDGGEQARVLEFVQRVDSYLAERGIARLSINPALAQSSPDFVAAMLDTNHQCGGLPMGVDIGSGVVDRDLRVFGTRNVHVAGAAVFPSSSHANCTLTALALAERLAAHLLKG